MGKFASAFALSIVALLLFGCVSQPSQTANLPPIPSPPTLVGGGKDAHGCIGSAGYTWCEAKAKCIRPWEENCTSQLDGGDRDSHGCIPSAGFTWCEALSQCIRPWLTNCTAVPTGGAACKTVADCGAGAARCVNGTCTQYDEHGCVPDGGYSWCPEKAKCVQPWVESCPSLAASALEAQAKSYCASGITVYTCGEYIRVVSDMPGAGSKFYTLGNYDPVATCPLVAPDSMSAQCSLLLFGNNCIEQEVKCNATAAGAPSAVTDLKDDPSFVGAQLSWSAPDATAVDYAIYRGDETLTQVSLIKTTGQKSYDDVFDGGNKTYAYFVRARNANGAESANSNIIYVQQLNTAAGPSPGQID